MVSRASPFACQVEEEGSGERATWLLNDVTLYYANKLMVSDCPAVHVEKKTVGLLNEKQSKSVASIHSECILTEKLVSLHFSISALAET